MFMGLGEFAQLPVYLTALPKIRRTICQLSGVSTRFQVYCPYLQVVHRNTCVNGANFVMNRHKTHLNTLK